MYLLARGAAIAVATAAVAVVDFPPMRCVSCRHPIYTARVRTLLVPVAAVCRYKYKYKYKCRHMCI